MGAVVRFGIGIGGMGSAAWSRLTEAWFLETNQDVLWSDMTGVQWSDGTSVKWS